MSASSSVNDEWFMFLNGQNGGLDISSLESSFSQKVKISDDVIPKSKSIPLSYSVSAVSENTNKTSIMSAKSKNQNGEQKENIVKKKKLVLTQKTNTGSLSVNNILSKNTISTSTTLAQSVSNVKNDTTPQIEVEEEEEENSSTEDPEINDADEPNEQTPVGDALNISTKTKVLFLNSEMDLNHLFWNIPIIEYWKPNEGVVKKQMKIISKTPEEYEELVEKLKNISYYTEHIIKQINNPNARRIKFKDERKITIGVSKKDIMNCRSKVKNAFYNCFAMIMRFKYEGIYREIHVKVFNTGKLEIPGVLNADILDIVSGKIINILQPFISRPLCFIEEKNDDNVLINSNFNCGFYVNREELYSILRSNKYNLETSYDPCIYPGIKCKFYFNNVIGFDKEKQRGNISTEDRNVKIDMLIDSKKYNEVSFMIFRTGSCLIVGNCSEKILKFIYEFIREILANEYSNIYVENDEVATKGKKQKLRKKNVFVSSNYYSTIVSTNM